MILFAELLGLSKEVSLFVDDFELSCLFVICLTWGFDRSKFGHWLSLVKLRFWHLWASQCSRIRSAPSEHLKWKDKKGFSSYSVLHIRPTQLLNATGKNMDIDDNQALRHQPSVASRGIFHHLIPFVIIRYWNISLDVTNGWYFRTWWSWMPHSMPVAKSN